MRSRGLATDLFTVCLCGWMAAYSCQALAQELPDVSVPCVPEVSEMRQLPLEHEGVSGIWIRLEVARCMLGRLQALPLYSQRVHLLDQRLELAQERHELMERQVALAEEAEERAVESLESASRLAREGQEAAEFERDLRWVWVGVGVVVVVALEALALWAYSELSGAI